MPRQQQHAKLQNTYAYPNTDDKTKDNESILTQRKLLDRFIESQPDIEAVSERIDNGISGVIFDRPAFNEMMSDIEKGKINCIVTKDAHVKLIMVIYGQKF